MSVDESAINYLKGLHYSRNIRDLKNLVERTLLVCDKSTLTADDFRIHYGLDVITKSNSQQLQSGLTLDDMERQTIIQAISQYGGNMTHVASALGISRAALYRRMEKYGIAK